jgi:2,4-diaminopentanoate dehydrogenase
MPKPYRVLVWGPGGLGSTCIWEVIKQPRFKLVGVRAYDPRKDGIDAGTLIGCEPCGVVATASAERALEIACDCVVYTARDHGNYNNDEEILRILRAGKNVVTALPYQHVRHVRDAAFVERLGEACIVGKSTFHATGVDPDVIGDRMLVALTGLCNDITYIKLQENWDSSYTPADTLTMCGFGKLPSEAKEMEGAATIARNFLRQVGYGMGEALGLIYSRVEHSHEYHASPVDLDCATLPIRAGTVGRVTHRWSGFTDSDQPFFSIEVNWVLGESMLPPGTQANQYWVATIEGRPSVKMSIDLKASMASGERFFMIGDTRSEPGYHATIAACLQAIPLICAAPPGILPIRLPAVHWKEFG